MQANSDPLARLLAAIGLTLQQLSSCTGIPATRLRSLYEQGNPTPLEAQRLAAVLRTTLATASSRIHGNYNVVGNANQVSLTLNIHIVHLHEPGKPDSDNRTSTLDTALRYRLYSALPTCQLNYFALPN